MSELVIRNDTGNQQSVFVSDTESAYNSSSTDRSVYHRNMICELALERGIKVLRTPKCSKAICVCKLRENPNFARVLELNSIGHLFLKFFFRRE